jgi:uncharacterized protein (DUF362 family)/Pyruvate/2-oxoacid:ferredoxin oxidoreductase delta subunit
MERVSIIGCNDYSPANIKEAVSQHFIELPELDMLISKGTKVLLKPNLLMKRRPEDATTTHPEFVAAIARECIRRGATVILADSPGGPYIKSQLKSIYNASGMEEAAKNTGFELNYDVGYKAMSTPNGKVCKSFNIINPVFDCDVIINICKLKTHAIATFSGAVKNLFGLVPGLMKPELHLRYPDIGVFGEMLVDLCEGIKPAINFMDGVIGMEGNGPSGGIPRYIGVTLASLNPYAVDLAASDIVNMNPMDVITLNSAIKRDLCPKSANELEIVGDDLGKFKINNFKMPDTYVPGLPKFIPKFIGKGVMNYLTPKPVIRLSKCIGCGKCAESCPAKTISIQNKKAVIDYSKCIKCFCCHEMCPVKVIEIKRRKFFNW